MVDHGRIAELLLVRYGARMRRLSPFYEDEGQAVYHVESDRGRSWVLRLFPPTRPHERVRGDGQILVFLERARFPAERVVRTLDGSVTSELDGRRVIVTRFIAGGPPARSSEDLESLGALVARLLALSPVPVELGRPAGSLPQEDLDQGLRWLTEVEALVPRGGLGEYAGLRAALETTDNCAGLPQALIHSDCQPGNAIRRADGRIFLIDWTGAGLGPRIAPLGLMLFGAAVASPGGPGGGPDLARIDPLIRGFRRHAELTGPELDRLADAVRFRPLTVAAREFANAVRQGASTGPVGWWSNHDLAGQVAERARDLLQGPGRRRRRAAEEPPPIPLEPPPIASVESCLRRLLGSGTTFAVEKVASGVSTPVYRVFRGGEVLYLRVAEGPEADLGPEMFAHEMLIDAGCHVPPVLVYSPREAEIGRSVALVGAIPGEAVGWRSTLSELELERVLRTAGEDLARVNAVRVTGFGWIRRDLGARSLVAEHPSLREWLRSGDNEDIEGCLRTVRRLAGLRIPDTALAAVMELVMDWAIAPRLAHGDFDLSHIFHVSGRYSGLIDFGEIRGAEPWYDLSLFFRLHSWSPRGLRMYAWLRAGWLGGDAADGDLDYRIRVTAWLIALRFAARQLRRHGRAGVVLPAIRDALAFVNVHAPRRRT